MTRPFNPMVPQHLTASATPGAARLPSLDGWRAFSILLVLGGHSTRVEQFPDHWLRVWNWVFVGDFGVRVFFLISGLLITWLLLREQSTRGQISLKRFYARRALRILPVYCAFLAMVGMLQLLTPFHQETGAWVANMTFTTGLTAWGATGIPWTTGHLWSLAVEEQFYIVWPLLLVFLSLPTKPRSAFLLLCVPVAVAPVVRVIGYANLAPSWLADAFGSYAFPSNFDALAIGCAAALLLRYRARECRDVLTHYRYCWGVVAVAMVALPHVARCFHMFGYLTVPFGDTLQMLGMAILIFQSILMPDWGLFRLLNIKVVVWIGLLSYSLYIWQQLFCTHPSVFGLGDVWWMSFPGWLLTTFTVAVLSFYLLEQPFMKLRAKLR